MQQLKLMDFMSTTIDTSLIQLRNNLSSFVEQAHYTNTQIRLTRHNKPIVRIVSERFMQNVDRLLQQDAGLRETLEIMQDANLLEMLEQSQLEVRQGQAHPLSDLLSE